MESMNKRCVFLEHVVGVIGLSNIHIVRGRAEVNQRNKKLHLNIFVVLLLKFKFLFLV